MIRGEMVSNKAIVEAAGPNGGFEGELTTADVRLINRARKEGWDIPPDMKSLLVGKLRVAIENANEDEDRAFLQRSLETLNGMERTNLAYAQFMDQTDRLDAGKSTQNTHHKIEFVIVDGRDSGRSLEA